MKISLWTKFGALNSKPVFDAFAQGAARLGYTVVYNTHNADVSVIWSMLWQGRMQGNREVWNVCKQKNKAVIVLEIGAIKRGKTWKCAVNGITNTAYYNFEDVDNSRIQKLDLKLLSWKSNNGNILIACQQKNSQQWDSPYHMHSWLTNILKEVRTYSEQKIIIRPHPRCPFDVKQYLHFQNIKLQSPNKILSSYDDYDFDLSNIKVVINYSSNPGVLAAIQGIPVYVSKKSLAYQVSNTDFSCIHDPITPDREKWLEKISFTEWTIDEFSTGYPLSRLTSKL